MTPSIRHVLCACLAFFVSLAWPWDVYTYVPYTSLGAVEFAAAVLVLLALVDAYSSRRLCISFELSWPPWMVALAWIAARPSDGLPIISGVLVYFATAHIIGGKADTHRLLLVSWPAITLLAVVNVFLRYADAQAWATAYALGRDALLWGPRDLSGGGWTFLWGGLLAGWTALDRRHRTLLRIGAGLSVLLMVGAAWPILNVGLGTHFRIGSVTFAGGLALIAGLWWLCRIAAKLVIEVEEKHDRVAAALVILMGTMVLYGVIAWPAPRMHHAFLLGLAAAAGKRHETSQPMPRTAWYLTLPMVLLLAWNMAHVYPENRRDPRNYDIAAARDYDTGRYELLDARMRHFQQRSPAERRTYYWRARKALTQGELRRASLALHAAIAPPFKEETLILPPPEQTTIEPLRNQLRDALSALDRPPGHIAFEAVLAEDSKLEGALDLLRLHLSPFRPQVPAMSPRVFAEAVAFLLRAPEAEEPLRAWEPEDLVAVLNRCGAIVEPAPTAFSAAALPLVLVADADLKTLSVRVFSGAQRHDWSIPFAPAPITPPRTPVDWEPDLGMTIEGWAFRLRAADDLIVTFEHRLDGSQHLVPNLEVAPATLEAASAIFVWLPPEDS